MKTFGKAAKKKAMHIKQKPMLFITTEESLFEMLANAPRQPRKPDFSDDWNIFQNVLDPLVIEVPERDDPYLFSLPEVSAMRAPYGSTIEGLAIEQWLDWRYGRADDLISAYRLGKELERLNFEEGLMFERVDGRSYVKSTKEFHKLFGVIVDVRLLH